MSTGTLSEEFTAQQILLEGAVQQVSPSHFRQKSMPRRHSQLWL